MRNRSAFTLVEILIVVIILGILAAIVIPQFTNASEDAKQSSVSSIVHTVQGQLELYKVQHLESYPGDNGGTFASFTFWTQLTNKTTEDGALFGNLGPYLRDTPVNPVAGGSTVVDASAPDSDLDGWFFDFTGGTGAFGANGL